MSATNCYTVTVGRLAACARDNLVRGRTVSVEFPFWLHGNTQLTRQPTTGQSTLFRPHRTKTKWKSLIVCNVYCSHFSRWICVLQPFNGWFSLAFFLLLPASNVYHALFCSGSASRVIGFWRASVVWEQCVGALKCMESRNVSKYTLFGESFHMVHVCADRCNAIDLLPKHGYEFIYHRHIDACYQWARWSVSSSRTLIQCRMQYKSRKGK